MFPEISMIAPQFKLFSDIGSLNSYQGMIVPSLSFVLPLAVWNLTAFVRQLPYELEEAAQIDGCSPGQAFRKVILPLAATMFTGSTQHDQPFGTPMAAGVIVTIPLVIPVLPFQRRIVAGLTAGVVT
jgi:multiple sugar transport system permease protein